MALAKVDSLGGNRLLANLTPSDRELLADHCKPVKLKYRQQLEGPNRKIRAAYFLQHGLASVVGIGNGQREQIEVAVIGWEGVTGIPLILGVDRSPHQTFMQLEGSAHCITAADLRLVMAESMSLRDCLLRYAYVLGVQQAHTALANAKGRVEERLARWLLMVHDRTSGDEIALTHEFIALMLGTRRAGVTNAIQQFEDQAMISHERGSITILDRDALYGMTNGLYGVPESEYNRLFPAPSLACA